jgi:hypothetical protein
MSSAFGVAAIFDVVTLLLAITLFRNPARPAVAIATAALREPVSVPGIADAGEAD